MSKPKVSEKEMIEHLHDFMDCVHPFRKGGYCPECHAIRAAIEERGRLRRQIEAWQKDALALKKVVDAKGQPIHQRIIALNQSLRFFERIRDFKLDGEEEK